MKVYRLEHPNGFGPFRYPPTRGDNQDCTWRYACMLNVDRPVFKKGDCKRDFCYGFTSKAHMRRYFGEALPFLVNNGYKVKRYFVRSKTVRYGKLGIEVAFHKDQVPELLRKQDPIIYYTV